MDKQLAVAIQILLYMATTDQIPSSENLAKSVNTNSSHIRKIIRSLKTAGLVQSSQGKSGFYLARSPETIQLSQIYQALYAGKSLLHLHQTPNPDCPIGARMDGLLTPVFDRAERALIDQLAKDSLADLIDQLYHLN